MTSLDANRIHYGEIAVIGAFSYHPSFHELALDMIKRGIIPAEKIITHKYSLDEIDLAFKAAAGGDALKVIVRI
jgi:L-iditol 2-dehydrogenase